MIFAKMELVYHVEEQTKTTHGLGNNQVAGYCSRK
jgi:hypothetical protein